MTPSEVRWVGAWLPIRKFWPKQRRVAAGALQESAQLCNAQLDEVLSGCVVWGMNRRTDGQVKSQNSHLLTRVGGQSIIGVARLY